MKKAYFSEVLAKVMLTSALVCASTLSAHSAFAETPKLPLTEADAVQASKAYDMGCNDFEDQVAERYVEKVDFKYKYSYDTSKDPERTTSYFIVTCTAGAYNSTSVLFRVEPYANVLQPVALATPRVNRDGKVTGFSADVINAGLSYDATTGTITSFAKGRGIGDMYVLGTYKLYESDVVLVKYFIDSEEGDGEKPGVVYESKLPITY